jgi:histone H3/H4
MSAPTSNHPQIPTATNSSMLLPSSAASGVPGSTAAAAANKTKKKITAKKATGPAATKAKAPKKPAAPRVKKTSASATSGKKTAGGAHAGANLTASSAESMMIDAAIARLDLAKQRSIAAQRKSDPMWYRIEDVVFSHTMDDTSMYNNSILPEQIAVVERALANVGGLNRCDVTPQAMVCLLEQARRIAYELCMDAQDYAYAAGRSDVSAADLHLAQELRSDVSTSSSVTTQLPKLNLTAQQVNRAPLPPIPTQCYTGVVLPPKAYQLTARTFDVVSASMVAQKMTQPVPKSPAAVLAQNKQRQSATSSSVGYGASRGRQIPIALKTNITAVPNSTGGATSNVSLPSIVAADATSAGAPANASVGPPSGCAATVTDSTAPTAMDVATAQPSSLASTGGVGNSSDSQSMRNSIPNPVGMTEATSSMPPPPSGNPPI